MAFRNNRPKSVVVPLWNLPKMFPQEIHQNQFLRNLIIVEEYSHDESVICSLQNPRKMAFKKIAQRITKIASKSNLARFGA
ncbi:unnamed protein product [Linum trigynum]|uniref:Uncharacterized protein n=1 Tax=Linum trigynum TaxID=586398 RepID=A0AAV2EDN8_9ROSI